MSDLSLKEIKKEWHGTLKSYVIGFASSLILTAVSFLLVVSKQLSGQTLVYSIIALAIGQAAVQLRFFLHLGQEPKPRWESVVFYFMVLILLIIAIGSLWIMYDLHHRLMDLLHD
ncbi:MAG TPA: cytochrome o ubiquinol oxidase subunit IV [Waddliaceae bacterium]